MSRARRILIALLSCVGVSGLAVAAGAWWHYASSADYRLRQGQAALRQGRPDKADRIATRLEADGHAGHAHLLRGEALLREQRYAEAVYELDQIRDREDLLLEASVIYGLGFVSLKKYPEAERLLRYVTSRRPDHRDAHRGLAVIYFDQGALGLALHHAQEWARLDPANGYPYRFMGLVLKDLQQYAPARDAYQEALRRALPDEVRDEVKEGLVEVLVLQKDYAGASAVLAACAPKLLGKPKMVACRAECFWVTGRSDEAKALLDQARERHPQFPDLLRLRARLHLSEKEPAPAVALLEQALRLDRHDSVSRYHLVLAYRMQGRPEEAAAQERLLQQTQEYLHELTKLNQEIMERPWDAALHRHAAVLCEKLNKPDLAAMWLQAAEACPRPKSSEGPRSLHPTELLP